MHLLHMAVVKVKYQGLRTECGIWQARGKLLLFCKLLEIRTTIFFTTVLCFRCRMPNLE